MDRGTPKNLTPGRKATITAARWRSDSRAIFGDEIVDGRFALSSATRPTASHSRRTGAIASSAWPRGSRATCGEIVGYAAARGA